MALVTQSEYAKAKGVSKQYISKIVKQGKLQLVDGRIDEELADEILCLSDRVSKIDDDSENTQDLHKRYWKARLKFEENRARILELEREEKEQSLIPAEEVRKTLFTKGRMLRDAFLNIPDRVAAELAGISDERQIHKILTREITDCLADLSRE